MTHDSGNTNPPMDFARIQDTSDGDIEFEQELFAAYLEDCSDRMARLHTALAEGNTELLHREAHTVKGASANVGTTHLHEIALKIERADIADTDSISGYIREAEAEFERVKAAINEYLASLGA